MAGINVLSRIASGQGHLAFRDEGPEIKALGQLLEAAGVAKGLQSETYGWQMLDALRSFKESKGLPKNGRVDRDVLHELVRAADSRDGVARVDPSLRAALGLPPSTLAPRIGQAPPPNTVPVHQAAPNPITVPPLPSRRPPPGGTGTPPESASVQRPAPTAPVAPQSPAQPPPAHWPVPGHFAINRSDRSWWEGDGEFGSYRASRDGRPRFHNGIDIEAPVGARVEPFAPGRVVFSGVMSGYGDTIIVQHPDNRQTVYAHLARRDVAVGAEVAPGTRIGTVGRSGNVPAPHLADAHLHFELRVGASAGLLTGTPVDPMPLLRKVQR